jgi:cytochrome c biogenesis protein CcmG/thiol:disulfide interchange protein DsbE
MGVSKTDKTVEQEHQAQRGLGRRVLIVLFLLVAAGFIGLLAGGLIKSGGQPGGAIVNTKLGEVPIQQRPARDFTLDRFDGESLTLSDLQGKVVMVDFWASWCPPCRQEAPALAQVYREYQARGVEFVGVSIWDTEKDANSYIQRYGITYPNGLDEKGVVTIDYGVTGIPEKYFIARDGTVIKKFIGPMNEEKLRAILDDMLAR